MYPVKNLFPNKNKKAKRASKKMLGKCKYCEQEFLYTKFKKYTDYCGSCVQAGYHLYERQK